MTKYMIYFEVEANNVKEAIEEAKKKINGNQLREGNEILEILQPYARLENIKEGSEDEV